MKKINIRVPGKVVINGSFIVLKKEMARSLAINKYLYLSAMCDDTMNSTPKFSVQVEEQIKHEFTLDAGIEDESLRYYQTIIQEFFRFTGIKCTKNIHLNIKFDDGFFANSRIKTGIGSSSCIFVGVLYSLIRFYESELILASKKLVFHQCPKVDSGLFDKFNMLFRNELMDCVPGLLYTLNLNIHKRGSGIDVFTCLFGSIQYNIDHIKEYGDNNTANIILGGFDRSTKTVDAIKVAEKSDLNWDEVISQNRLIIDLPTKENFEKYLDSFRYLSANIVPDLQYNILKKSFDFNIRYCGISGSGGEDAVWCIYDKDVEILEYWQSIFNYIIEAKVLGHGLEVFYFAN